MDGSTCSTNRLLSVHFQRIRFRVVKRTGLQNLFQRFLGPRIAHLSFRVATPQVPVVKPQGSQPAAWPKESISNANVHVKYTENTISFRAELEPARARALAKASGMQKHVSRNLQFGGYLITEPTVVQYSTVQYSIVS